MRISELMHLKILYLHIPMESPSAPPEVVSVLLLTGNTCLPLLHQDNLETSPSHEKRFHPGDMPLYPIPAIKSVTRMRSQHNPWGDMLGLTGR